MSIAEKAGASRNPFERTFAALIDPVRGERTVLVLLAGYAAAWSLYGAIAKGSQDLHFDIGEMFAWSHQIGLSAPTHPPLGAWLAWRGATDKPLRIVGGNRPVVDGSNFYFADPPATFVVTEPMRTPWVDQARIGRDGIAIVCARTEPPCLRELDALVTRYGGKTEDITLARRFFGLSDTPVDYQIAIIPPR